MKSLLSHRFTGLACLLALGLTACSGGREILAKYPNGSPKEKHVEIQLEDGQWIKEGEASTWHANGELESQGFFVAGARSGPWVSWGPDGNRVAQGAYQGGEPAVRSGPWRFWYPTGVERARGAFLFGQKEGVWVHRNPDGAINGKETGVFEAGMRMGDVAVDGRVTEWFDNGQERFQSRYESGVRHGPALAWYADGNPRYTGQFERGHKSGAWRYWSEDGTLDQERSGVYNGWSKVSDN